MVDDLRPGTPVDSMANVEKFIRSRRVRLNVRFLKSTGFFRVVATCANHRGNHRIVAEDASLPHAIGKAVDAVNAVLGIKISDTGVGPFSAVGGEGIGSDGAR